MYLSRGSCGLSVSGCRSDSIEVGGGIELEASELRLVKIVPQSVQCGGSLPSGDVGV